MQKKKILLLGGTGYIGTEFTNLFGQDYFITSTYYDELKFFNSYKKELNANYFQLDIREKKGLISLLKNKFDIILFLLGQQNKDPEIEKELNLTSVENLINAIKSLKEEKNTQIIYASSVMVYGGGEKKFCESDDLKPQDNYSILKMHAEEKIKGSSIPFKILRFSNVYGKIQTKGLISYIIDAAKNNKTFFYEDLNKVRSFLHVNDAAISLKLAIDSPLINQTYNISSENKTIKYIIKIVEKIILKKIDKKVKFFGDPKVLIVKNQKAKKYLKFKPTWNIQSGLKDMLVNN